MVLFEKLNGCTKWKRRFGEQVKVKRRVWMEQLNWMRLKVEGITSQIMHTRGTCIHTRNISRIIIIILQNPASALCKRRIFSQSHYQIRPSQYEKNFWNGLSCDNELKENPSFRSPSCFQFMAIGMELLVHELLKTAMDLNKLPIVTLPTWCSSWAAGGWPHLRICHVGHFHIYLRSIGASFPSLSETLLNKPVVEAGVWTGGSSTTTTTHPWNVVSF